MIRFIRFRLAERAANRAIGECIAYARIAPGFWSAAKHRALVARRDRLIAKLARLA